MIATEVHRWLTSDCNGPDPISLGSGPILPLDNVLLILKRQHEYHGKRRTSNLGADAVSLDTSLLLFGELLHGDSTPIVDCLRRTCVLSINERQKQCDKGIVPLSHWGPRRRARALLACFAHQRDTDAWMGVLVKLVLGIRIKRVIRFDGVVTRPDRDSLVE